MSPTLSARITCTFLCLLTVPAFAQYTVKKIVFDNPGQYTQAALEAASGLKPGGPLSTETLQQAAQRLSDTGAFEDVQVTLDGPTNTIAVLFKVKPLDPAHQLTATFDNFIWLSPEQLDTELHTRVPLYATILPESGNLQDAVEAALAAIAQEKGVAITITHRVYEPSAEQPVRTVAYRVKSPAIYVHTVHLAGVTPEFAPAIREHAGKIAGHPFEEGREHLTTADVLLEPYLTAGYTNAQLSGRTLTPVASTAGRIDVDLAATIVPGAVFHIGTISWAGSEQLSSDAFVTASPLHPGDLASTRTLAKAVELIATAYHQQGYNDVLVSPALSVDPVAHLVSYTFSATPGGVYHVRSVTPLNLSPAQQNDFNRGWRLKSGDIYNPEYIRTFLKQNTALRSFEGYSASFKATSDPETHLVDVTITFARTAAVPIP